MPNRTSLSLGAAALITTALAPRALANIESDAVLGTQTITNATHYGYFGFASTSQFNTKATVGPFTGTARRITVTDGGPFVGKYSNIITGPGSVFLGQVPEPATLATIAAASLMMLRRRP